MGYYLEEGEDVARSFSDDREMWIGKGKILLKLNPKRDDVEKKAYNFKCDEKSRLLLYVLWCVEMFIYWYKTEVDELECFEEA